MGCLARAAVKPQFAHPDDGEAVEVQLRRQLATWTCGRPRHTRLGSAEAGEHTVKGRSAEAQWRAGAALLVSSRWQ